MQAKGTGDDMAKKEHRVLLGIVIAIALLIRIGYVAQTYIKDPLRTDAGQYARYAHNIVHHDHRKVKRRRKNRRGCTCLAEFLRETTIFRTIPHDWEGANAEQRWRISLRLPSAIDVARCQFS